MAWDNLSPRDKAVVEAKQRKCPRRALGYCIPTKLCNICQKITDFYVKREVSARFVRQGVIDIRGLKPRLGTPTACAYHPDGDVKYPCIQP